LEGRQTQQGLSDVEGATAELLVKGALTMATKLLAGVLAADDDLLLSKFNT